MHSCSGHRRELCEPWAYLCTYLVQVRVDRVRPFTLQTKHSYSSQMIRAASHQRHGYTLIPDSIPSHCPKLETCCKTFKNRRVSFWIMTNTFQHIDQTTLATNECQRDPKLFPPGNYFFTAPFFLILDSCTYQLLYVEEETIYLEIVPVYWYHIQLIFLFCPA